MHSLLKFASFIFLGSLLFFNSNGQSKNSKVNGSPLDFTISGNEFNTGKTYTFPPSMDVLLLTKAVIIDEIDKRTEVRSMAHFPSDQNPLEEVTPIITFDGTSAASYIIKEEEEGNSTASISISFNQFKIFNAKSGSVIIDAYDHGSGIVKGHFTATGWIGITDRGKYSETKGYTVEGKFNVKLKKDN